METAVVRKNDKMKPRKYRVSGIRLEMELINVVLVEDEWFAQQNVIAFDLHLAKPSGLERRCTGFKFALRQRHGCFPPSNIPGQPSSTK